MAKKKIAVVSTHPIQHYVPVYVNLSKRDDIELKVFFLAENGTKPYKDKGFGVDVTWDFSTLDGYDYDFLESGKIAQSFSLWEMDSRKLIPALEKFCPDAVWIHGYSYFANWRVVHWRKRLVQKIYTSDSNLTDDRKWWQRLIKIFAVRYFFKQCDTFISIGKNNTDYLRYYGVSEKQIFSSSFPIDMNRLIKNKENLTAKDSHHLRRQYDIPQDAMLLLFSGKLVDYKRPIDVVRSLAELKDLNIYVLFMGDGELRKNLQTTAIKLDVTDRVKIAGFVNQNNIANYMYASDVLVLPSEKEPFGAVVSEGLPFALPIIVSDRIGSIGSSAIEGENALVYKCGDVNELSECIRTLFNDKKLYKQMSKASEEFTWQHDCSVMADTISGVLR